MFHIDFNRKIFWVIAALVVFSNSFLTYMMYQKNQDTIEARALAKANILKNYFISMRNIYHHQFLKSGLDVNSATIGFLPANASTFISDKFAELSEDGTAIRNVTDRARNEKNKADKFELEAIEYFKKNPNKTMYMRKIEQNGREIFNFTSPLVIEPYCISCHGKKEETLPSIQKMYDNAYDYKVGDIRGVTSIKIPSEELTNESMKSFYSIVILGIITTLFLLIIIYYVIRELTLKDVAQKILLQDEVKIKTAHLQEQKNELKIANTKQQHLLSMLRTVADCNEILITATNIDELIQNAAISMHSNTSFAGIKILIHEEGVLRVKSSVGLDEEMEVLPLEEDVFKNNHNLFLKSFDESLPQKCLEKVKRHNITEVYMLALRKKHYAKKALGVMIIYSTKESGFSMEEQDIINELAGDIGFAINSLYQKDAIKQLSYYDQLTNLPNLNLFEQHLNQAFVKSSESLKYGAVLLLDFDDFKAVNDLMGKDIGDEVLKEMAKRLVSKIDKASMNSRVGGDKFLILVEDLSSEEKESAIIVKQLAQKIVAVAKEPFILDGKTFHLTCSVGITLFFDHKIKLKTVLNQVEHAMRVAKESGKNLIKFYDQVLQDMTNSRSLMLQNLKKAVLENQFVLYYQK
ncbi:MAG: diguanylate cyclase, partial [Campylobacterota bacterium]|nr:diguanylate cyclase [Campylobacterota bacterium]